MKNAGQLLNQFLGGQGAGGAGGGTGVDLQSMLSGKGGLATGAVVGGLAGLMLGGKKPKKIAKKALKVGGVALVGGLAYKAYRDWQNNKATAPAPLDEADLAAPADSAFLPQAAAAQDDLGTALVRAMINAAKADGHITPDERARISEQLGRLSLENSHRQFVETELAKPMDIEAVAGSVDCPEQKAEIYLASVLIVDRNGPAEQGYLAMLAARMGLEADLVAHLHAAADAAEQE
ncbi:tellurite resistance TerB family protein [Aestuariispira insulae]|uniref:Uncharacterized membrane protein YebE (DUF533 family) n=1 Tax=Aestuariispira insulae TaxID=1461337 RepID=A0A3D9HI59_9PROT|nr:tellurite resistance TerB family protein [Aestuariispira insulae]RED48646.1 uncharacterized membrane protein YebE (DUF533 family) [Aestuariispira insulae]